MRFKVLAYLMGTLLIYLGAVLFVPLIWTLLDQSETWRGFVYAAVLALSLGFVLRYRNKMPQQISIKESFTFVALAWTISATVGAIPYLFSGGFTFIDAFFESISGFTTTGATIIKDVEVLSRDLLFWRSLTQWLGGMGIIVLFVAMLSRLGVWGVYLLKAEVPGPGPERIVPRIAETAKRLWIVYLVISLVQFLLLAAAGLSLFDALIHTFTTMPTGGFSSYNGSIGAFNNVRAEIIIIFFMILAGGNFTLYYGLWQKQWRHLFADVEFRFYCLIIIISTIVLAVLITPQFYPNMAEGLRHAAFQAISIVTTTGYVTANYEQWPALARVLLFFLMFLGGSGGSTGGGMKQIRILILIKYAVRELHKILHPSAVIPLRLGGRVIPETMVHNTVGFSLLYFIIFFVSSLLVSAMGLDFVTSFGAVASCLGNVGPALGSLGPTETYTLLPSAAKGLLSIIMLMGRLEIYTILILLLPEVHSSRFHISAFK
ncbi:MAG: TrkH family potassium uptake protein [Bacillota bacterium]